MKIHTNMVSRTLKIITIALISTNAYSQSDALAPPSIGEQTKGKPAIAETIEPSADNSDSSQSNSSNTENQSALNAVINSTTTVTEHKRDSGQVYLIEFENSLGGKQYLDEGISDGKVGSSTEDKENINPIPKWKLGSW